MALTHFQPNNDGFRGIANSPQMKAALKAVAEKGKGVAESLSAEFTDLTDDDKKHYVDSFEVRPVTVQWDGEYPGPRASVQLINTADYAASVEYGSGPKGGHGSSKRPTSSAHHVLGRTLDILAGEA